MSHFPPFVLNSRLATHAHLLCARALCVYIEREKRGPSSNVSVHTDTYVMTYFPRKNKKKRFLLLLFFLSSLLHTCVQFSLWLELITAQQLTKRLLLFPCKLYYEGQTLVTVQRVMSFLHAHFITTTVLWWWCWTRSKLQRSLSPSVHTPKAFPTASNFWFLFEKNNASRKWLQRKKRDKQKTPRAVFRCAHSPLLGMPSINNETRQPVLMQYTSRR